jgi:hypothetical protein
VLHCCHLLPLLAVQPGPAAPQISGEGWADQAHALQQLLLLAQALTPAREPAHLLAAASEEHAAAVAAAAGSLAPLLPPLPLLQGCLQWLVLLPLLPHLVTQPPA